MENGYHKTINEGKDQDLARDFTETTNKCTNPLPNNLRVRSSFWNQYAAISQMTYVFTKSINVNKA